RVERVQLRPRMAADLEAVLEAARGEQHDARPAVLEQRVGRDRGAVVQSRRSPGRQALEAFAHRPRRVVRRGAELQHRQPSPDQGDEVGERAAGVDPDDDPGQASAAAALDSALGLAEPLLSLEPLLWVELLLSPELLLSLVLGPLPSPELSPFSPVFFAPWPPRP